MPDQNPTLSDYDRYITQLFAREDAALESTREEMKNGNLPPINVSASEGGLLNLFARIINAKKILEIGTLGGYSATWLARALPEDGTMISLELDPHHAEVSRANLVKAGLADKVEIRVGPAIKTLEEMHANGEGDFDLVFIDADKETYPDYLRMTLPMVRKGGLILADNTLPPSVLDSSKDGGAIRYNADIAANSNLVSSVIPVLRGHLDGLTVSVKIS